MRPPAAGGGNGAIEVSTMEDVQRLEQRLRDSAATARDAIADALENTDALGLLQTLKFEDIGAVPLEPGTPHNVLQQVHQTFYYLVMLRGAEYLLHRHPDAAPFRLVPQGAGAPDIVSADGRVVAETLALQTAVDNNKLRSDISRLREHPAGHRYVFVYTADGTLPEDDEVTIVPVALNAGQ